MGRDHTVGKDFRNYLLHLYHRLHGFGRVVVTRGPSQHPHSRRLENDGLVLVETHLEGVLIPELSG
jgi:hypothetical protein